MNQYSVTSFSFSFSIPNPDSFHFFLPSFSHLSALAVVAVSGQQNRPRQGRQQGAPAAYGAPEQPQYGLQADASSLSEAQEDHQGTDWLLKSVPGTPGTDYPILAEVPETKFECNGQVEGGENQSLK